MTDARSQVLAWTDGSCRGNPGPGGYAALLRAEDGRERELTGGESVTTNNRMERMAAIVALEGRLEVECALAGAKDAEKKAPPYCVRGPGNTGLHCVTGTGESACPHAFLVVERSKLKLSDRAGKKATIETDGSGKGAQVDK